MFVENKVVMCGCGEIGAYLLPRLHRENLRISHLVALTPEQAKRYKISGYQDLRPVADLLSIPWSTPETYSLSARSDLEFFEKQQFDVILQGGWQRLFPAPVLDTLKFGAIGIHGSADLLPKGRGRSPLNWSLLERKTRFYAHLFVIKPGIDDGDVIDVAEFDITQSDDIETLYFKLTMMKQKMLLRTLPRLLAGQAEIQPQVGKPSYYPKRTPADGVIDWEEMDVQHIVNMVRALTKPYPGAFGLIADQLTTIWRARLFDTRMSFPRHKYGAVVEEFGTRLIINCRGGLLLVDEHQQRR